MSGGGKTRLAAKIALWGGREIAGLLLVSLLAGAATIPFIAYHFHRISPYGVIANLVAMPAVSVWVMPAGILGVMGMLALARTRADHDVIALARRILLNHDRVGARRQDAARKDPGGLAGADRSLERVPRRHFADEPEADRHFGNVGGADGVAVHG